MAPKRDAAALTGMRFADGLELRRHLGGRLAEIRDRRSFNQSDLADKAGVGLRQLQKLERAQGGGSLETWLKLAHALDVALDEFFQRSAAPATTAREQGTTYRLRNRTKQTATKDQLDTLMSVARQLDAKTVDGLIFFARKR